MTPAELSDGELSALVAEKVAGWTEVTPCMHGRIAGTQSSGLRTYIDDYATDIST